MVRTAADVTAADVTTIFYLFNHSIPDLRQERTYTASAAVTSVWKRQWLVRLGKGPLPSHRRSWRSSLMGPPPVHATLRSSRQTGQRPPEERYLACHRQGRPGPGGLPETEHPMPEKMGGHSPLEQEDGGGSAGDGLPTWHHSRHKGGLASARWERGKTPVTQAASRGPGGSVDSAVTPPKVWKGHKKPSKSGKSSTVEKTAIISAAQEGPASPIPAAQEDPAIPIPAAQEYPASPIPAAQEGPASPSPAAQEGPASPSPAAQEGPASPSPAGP
ncbi:hypothetical protein NDU88_004749 [Pleurodeles waltl]|uniref:Uncharacterized protein n=1 Tax=Pleurodeles waltl TaxID=8319 RepID=A0AAV7NPD7_PLEWA|nr:hypothetical protein NDU88_004749 [Pleurodeles waltl]